MNTSGSNGNGGRPAAGTLGGHEPDESPHVPISRILRLFRPYRGLLGVLVLIVVVQALVGVASPFFLRSILDDALPGHNFSELTWLALGMVASAVGASSLGVLTNRLSSGIGQRLMKDLRVQVYAHLQRMSLAFFTRTHTGEVMSRLVNDVGGVNQVLTSTASSLAQNGTTAVAMYVGLIVMDWQLALAALVVMPIFVLFTRGLGKQRRKLAHGRQHGMARLTSLIEESLSVPGVILAKTMGLQDVMRGRFADRSAEISDFDMRSAMAGQWRSASRRMSLTVLPAVLYWVAGFELSHGAEPATIGTIVAFTSMVNRLVTPVTSMQGIGQNFSQSLALFGRIFEVLDLPVDVEDRPGARALTVDRGDVAARGVWFRYPGAADWTVSDIDLVVPAGTVTAIVGETGSGKTTLAYLLARLYEPDQGAVTIDGVDVRDVTLDSLSEAVGLVSQDTYLLHTTVRENLVLARRGVTEEELVAATRAAHVYDTIMTLPDGFDTLVGERGYRFSGGERQRLAIARMLLRNPPVLVLDEATSALDTRTERAVQDALAELSKGRTTIVIAHRLSTIMEADQILVMHGAASSSAAPTTN